MNELVKLVSQKVGISEEQSRQAVTMVIDFLKERLPAPIAGQIDTILNNPSIGSAIGGLFGNK